MGSVAGGGPLTLLALPVRPVYLPPFPLGPWIRRGGLVQSLLPPPVVLVQVGVTLAVTAQRLAAPAPISPVLWVWACVCGLCRTLTGPA